MVTVTTAVTNAATAYPPSRKLDVCQNGVRWAFTVDAGAAWSINASYATDQGATWSTKVNTNIVTAATQVPVFSIFIDLDDYCHIVYKNSDVSGFIYYRRGTPNAGKTSWTWSSAQAIHSSNEASYPTVVAHRQGTGWVAHIVHSRAGTGRTQVWYQTVTISSGGAFTLGSAAVIGGSDTGMSGLPSYPDIDFKHTGDGKTVAGATPDLYVVWSAGATGSGKGLRFRKAVYSAGPTWTWNTERELDSTRYIQDNSRWMNCLFDGTRVILPGLPGTGAQDDLMLYERDAADTTTTTRTLVSNVGFGQMLYAGCATYDSAENVYFIGRDGSSNHLDYVAWDRATTTLGSHVQIDSATSGSPFATLKRGASDSLLEFIYTDGTASPWSIVYGSVTLNVAPDTPTALTRTGAETDTTPNLSLSVTDPNTGDQIKGRFEIQTAAGAAVGTIDSSFRTGDGTVTAEYGSTLSPGNYRVRATALDDDGAQSAATDWVYFDVTVAVSPLSLNLLWNVRGNYSKDLSLLWDVAVNGQKDLSMLWNVREYVSLDLELLWSQKTPWTRVQNDESTWERVYT